MAELDYGLYPSREMQMVWLKEYLMAYKLFTKKSEEVSPRELETLYVQVNKFALVRKELTLFRFLLRTRVLDIQLSSSYLSQGLSLLLGVLGSDPSQIFHHRL